MKLFSPSRALLLSCVDRSISISVQKSFFLTRIHVAREQAQKSGYAILNGDFLPFACVRL